MIAATRPLSWVSSPDFGPLVKIQAALFSKRLFCGNRGFISSAWPCCAFGVFTTSRRIINMLWSASFPWCARHINIFWGISNSFYGCTCACRCVINILWSLWSVIFRSALVATPATPTELGLESSESRAWESCSANLLVSLEEHLSNGGLDLNLLKYFALNNAIFRLLFPDSF